MKKLVFIMPLMVVSFLESCGGKAKQFTVTFDTDGGSYIESQKVSSGEKATKPNNPTKEQTDIYTFDFNEWRLDGATYDFNTPVTKDITLKASYNKSTRHYLANATNENNLIFTTLNDDHLTNIDITAGQIFKFKVKADNGTGNDRYVVPSILNISIKGMEPLVDGYKVINPGEEESEVTIDANKVIGNIVISGEAPVEGIFNYQVSSHYGLEAIDSDSATKDNPLTLTFTPESSYTKPKAENIYIYFDEADAWISPADTGVSEKYCSYDENSGELTIKVDHILNSIDIKARANNYKLLESLTWGKINELSIIGAAPYVFYLGEEKTVNVNTLDHKVRIIDFNHDELSLSSPDNPEFAGITFEFTNLISDEFGNSLGTPWSWENGDSSNHYDFPNSSLRKAIDGEGQGEIWWYHKGSEETTKNPDYKNKSVYEMLPSSSDRSNPDLKEVLKKVRKPVATTSSYEITAYDTLLFPLSYHEMTEAPSSVKKDEGTTYQIYKGEGDTNENRWKSQIYWNLAAIQSTEIQDRKSWYPENYAGFQYNGFSQKLTECGMMWLRTPDYASYSHGHYSTYMSVVGNISDCLDVSANVLSVAPAFCI